MQCVAVCRETATIVVNAVYLVFIISGTNCSINDGYCCILAIDLSTSHFICIFNSRPFAIALRYWYPTKLYGLVPLSPWHNPIWSYIPSCPQLFWSTRPNSVPVVSVAESVLGVCFACRGDGRWSFTWRSRLDEYKQLAIVNSISSYIPPRKPGPSLHMRCIG